MTEEKSHSKKVYSLFNQKTLNLKTLPDNVVTKMSGTIHRVDIPHSLIENHEKFFADKAWRKKLFVKTKPNSSMLSKENCLRVFVRDYNELQNLQQDLVSVGLKLVLPSE